MTDSAYLVALADVDGQVIQVLCTSYRDLQILLDNLDNKTYNLLNAVVVNNLSLDYKDYCKQENELEKGRS